MTGRNARGALLALLPVLASCGNDGGNAASSGARADAGGPAGAVRWSVSSESDPMTDATSRIAAATFPGQRADIQVRVACTQSPSGPAFVYTVASFDKNGAPAELASVVNARGTFNTLMVRADRAAPVTFSEVPRFNNQVSTDDRLVLNQTADGFRGIAAGVHLARAATIIMRIPVAAGDETITFQQDDPALRSVLDPCLNQVSRAEQDAERATRERQAQESQRLAQQAADEQARTARYEEEARARAAAERDQMREQRAAYERQQREDQAALCAQIARSGGARDEAYLRLQGCR